MNGKKVIIMAQKDVKYEKARNKLIPKAVQYADTIAGPKPKTNSNSDEYARWGNVWNQSFHSMMDALARQAGLVR